MRAGFDGEFGMTYVAVHPRAGAQAHLTGRDGSDDVAANFYRVRTNGAGDASAFTDRDLGHRDITLNDTVEV